MNTTSSATLPIGSRIVVSEGERVDQRFVDRVLAPYRKNCQYLKAAYISYEGDPSWESLRMLGEFAIDMSCYIDDTGHFNAVEFNICYNQLAYVHLAYCIENEMMQALDKYHADNFREKQLSSFLIADLSSQYHAPLNPRQFVGEVRVESTKIRSRLSILSTLCRFHDDANGCANGKVTLAVLNP